jgi:hypothetical protein
MTMKVNHVFLILSSAIMLVCSCNNKAEKKETENSTDSTIIHNPAKDSLLTGDDSRDTVLNNSSTGKDTEFPKPILKEPKQPTEKKKDDGKKEPVTKEPEMNDGPRKDPVTEEVYKGKLEIKALCMNYTIRLVNGILDSSKISTSWKNEENNKSYTNVFALANPCDFPSDIKQGDEFYFIIADKSKKDCAVCMAYYPVPPKKLSIKVINH